ncbi:GreA/GreB family elongation factor [Dasania marina]|uniref:GreA/GreB family elongation factor n=1 Tax=Dasania marina TaxID=471499 RepID=UPI0030DB85C4|tara:strand:- start:7929 stop:8330 length:402 start_codon:yes stop_codon:yes gene_type:complete
MKALTPYLSIAANICAREYLLTRPRVMMNHLSLANIFEKIEKHKTNKANNQHIIRVGSRIKLLGEKKSSVIEITLTESDDCYSQNGKVSVLSLLGSKLLGAEEGECISVNVLWGKINFTVLSVNNAQPLKGGD